MHLTLKKDGSMLRHYLQRNKLMQPLEFGNFSYKELLAQRKIVPRAMSRSRDAQKAQSIIARIDDELEERWAIKFSRAGKKIRKINFNE
tara:strand:- start:68 stop:334 length:267 start_codon:yes stop_codon:yes gene_type:complete